IPVSSFFFFSSRRRHTRFSRDWSSDVCSSDLLARRVTAETVPSPAKIRTCRCPSPATALVTDLGGDALGRAVRMGQRAFGPPERSEERRVGKESRPGWSRHHQTTKNNRDAQEH